MQLPVPNEQPDEPVIRTRNHPEVTTVTGQTIKLLHRREKELYELARDKYSEEYEFTLANDFRMLDRLLLLEVEFSRYQWFTSAQMDYEGTDLLAKELSEYRSALKDIGKEIREIQNDLGVTKAQRDKAGVNDVGEYLQQLRLAAKAHGIKREKELGKAIELCKELFALVGAFQRSNENERRKLGFESSQDVVDWVESYMVPEFNAIDEYFRNA